jgi:hypothetical protein
MTLKQTLNAPIYLIYFNLLQMSISYRINPYSFNFDMCYSVIFDMFQLYSQNILLEDKF